MVVLVVVMVVFDVVLVVLVVVMVVLDVVTVVSAVVMATVVVVVLVEPSAEKEAGRLTYNTICITTRLIKP